MEQNWQNMQTLGQILDSKMTSHTTNICGVPVMWIWENTDHGIMKYSAVPL